MEEPAIQLENLTLRLGGATGIERLSLEVRNREKVVLVGPSGCGKSTVLRCILGFAIPDQGLVRIRGEQLTAESVWQLRARLAYVGQEPELGSGRVERILQRPFGYAANQSLRYDPGRVAELLDMLHLPPAVLEQEIQTLSGGEKQRLAIILAVLLRRDIYVLDEISSALDRKNRVAVAEFFRSQTDATALLATHESGEFADWDRVVQLPVRRTGGSP